VTGDWRVLLAASRRPVSAGQAVWDGHWLRWLAIARRSGRTLNQAVPVAYTRTEAQYGPRPTQPAEENQT